MSYLNEKNFFCEVDIRKIHLFFNCCMLSIANHYVQVSCGIEESEGLSLASCQCDSGYADDSSFDNKILFTDGGFLNCSDFDECSNSTQNECTENQDCVNTIGSYECICKEDFVLNSIKTDCVPTVTTTTTRATTTTAPSNATLSMTSATTTSTTSLMTTTQSSTTNAAKDLTTTGF